MSTASCDTKSAEYWNNKVEANQSDPHKLWQLVDDLLGRGGTPVNSAVDIEVFNQFFADKVAKVRSSTANAPAPTFTQVPPGVCFQHFRPLTTDDVINAIRRLPDQSSSPDPVPTSVLKQITDIVAPFIAELFNCLLFKGLFPAQFKEAFSPEEVLKKSGLDVTSASSYRTISNLSVLSKLLERLVARQMKEYLSLADLLPPLQSGFRQGHSTEIAVLQVLSDILQAVDRGDLAALVLLDLSAAFDTVDHSILLEHLQQTFGISDTALCWFQSYLSSRIHYVRRGLNKLSVTYVICGMPQGSVLGPILFVL